MVAQINWNYSEVLALEIRINLRLWRENCEKTWDNSLIAAVYSELLAELVLTEQRKKARKPLKTLGKTGVI